jgi:hypothetical protein
LTAVVPYDDLEIENHEKIIRRVSQDQHLVLDENRNVKRLSTKLFSASSGQYGGMSVDIEKLIISSGVDPKGFVTTPKYMGSVYFTAELARSLGLMIGYHPIPGNDYHGEVWNGPNGGRFTGSQQKGLLNGCAWYVQIGGVELL